MAVKLDYQTRKKTPTEAFYFVFSFEEFSEIVGGATVSSAVVTGPGGVALSGITAASPGTVLTDDETVDRDGTTVAADKGVKSLVSGGTAGTDYTLECKATFSDGSIRVVQGVVAVRNKE